MLELSILKGGSPFSGAKSFFPADSLRMDYLQVKCQIRSYLFPSSEQTVTSQSKLPLALSLYFFLLPYSVSALSVFSVFIFTASPRRREMLLLTEAR